MLHGANLRLMRNVLAGRGHPPGRESIWENVVERLYSLQNLPRREKFLRASAKEAGHSIWHSIKSWLAWHDLGCESMRLNPETLGFVGCALVVCTNNVRAAHKWHSVGNSGSKNNQRIHLISGLLFHVGADDQMVPAPLGPQAQVGPMPILAQLVLSQDPGSSANAQDRKFVFGERGPGIRSLLISCLRMLRDWNTLSIAIYMSGSSDTYSQIWYTCVEHVCCFVSSAPFCFRRIYTVYTKLCV